MTCCLVLCVCVCKKRGVVCTLLCLGCCCTNQRAHTYHLPALPCHPLLATHTHTLQEVCAALLSRAQVPQWCRRLSLDSAHTAQIQAHSSGVRIRYGVAEPVWFVCCSPHLADAAAAAAAWCVADDGKEVELSVPGKKPEEVLELVQDPTLWPAPQEAKAAPQKQRKQPQQPQLDEAEAMS